MKEPECARSIHQVPAKPPPWKMVSTGSLENLAKQSRRTPHVSSMSAFRRLILVTRKPLRCLFGQIEPTPGAEDMHSSRLPAIIQIPLPDSPCYRMMILAPG